MTTPQQSPTADIPLAKARNEGAVVAGDGRYIFNLQEMAGMDAGRGYSTAFGPVVEGFDHVPFNNMNAVRDAIGPTTAGVIVEPIQGEGGVRPGDLQFMRDLRAACDEYGLLLGMDEVQSGMGRTGKLFAHEWAGIARENIL